MCSEKGLQLGGLVIHSGLRACLANELHVVLQGILRVEPGFVENNIERNLG